MNKDIKQFVGRLMTFDKRGEGEQVVETDVFLEVTDFNESGEVEVAFMDRNERCYLRMSLPELAAHIGLHAGKAS